MSRNSVHPHELLYFALTERRAETTRGLPATGSTVFARSGDGDGFVIGFHAAAVHHTPNVKGKTEEEGWRVNASMA